MTTRQPRSKRKHARKAIHLPPPSSLISIAVLILLIILSMTAGNAVLSSPEFHSKTISILDAQKTEALTLSVAVTAASTALSVLPDDTASPIADELADLSLPLFLIVAIIYMEIFLLTTFGWIASTFLIPAACVLLIVFILCRKEFLLIWLKKLAILTVALLVLIPASASITAHIEDTFSETIDQKLHAASHIANIAESEDDEDANAILSFFSGLADSVTSLVSAARNMLSTLVDAVAILIITSCILPILTLLVFLYVLKAALNVEIPTKYLALLVPPTKKDRQRAEKLKNEDIVKDENKDNDQ